MLKIILKQMTDQNYAINPQIEQRGTHTQMHVNLMGCTHVLTFRTPLDQQIDLTDKDVWGAMEFPPAFFDKEGEEHYMEKAKVWVQCTRFLTLMKHGDRLALQNQAANYAICACKYNRQSNEVILFMPNETAAYRTIASVEVRYSIKAYKLVKKGFFTQTESPTGFYEVVIGDQKSNFDDGSILYKVREYDYSFPVTAKMKGKSMLIKSSNEPKFTTTVQGIVLKRV